MRFVFADALDLVDPGFDFIADRNARDRTRHSGDQYPHEFLDEAPYDGILVSRAIVGDAFRTGKYSESQMMRFRREGARRFLRYPEERYPGSIVMGDCGAFSYAAMPEPPYKPEDTLTFYGDGGFTHGCSPDHIIFDLDEGAGRNRDAVPEGTRRRFDLTLQNASEFLTGARRLGRDFTPMGVVQGWSAPSMAQAAVDLARMGYKTLAVGGTVPLKIEQIRLVLAAIRDAVPISTGVRLHVLGFGKIEHLADLERFGVASFDTTSPLVRAFKDARKNYWARDDAGNLAFYTALRIPQAIENNHLKRKALKGSVNQEAIQRLEATALAGVRRFAAGDAGVEEALDSVMAYWDALNWDEEVSAARQAEALRRQRQIYARTLEDRPWERCGCRVCREGGVEALIFRSSNRNKRRGMHNLHVFHRHLSEFRAEVVA